MKLPIWILESVVLKVHDAQLAEHGGLSGIRDKGLLESALSHPQNLFSYDNPSIYDLATAYAERIAKNHPFIDGNKRTAYVVMNLFLRLNGYKLTAPKAERVVKMVQLATNKINIAEFAVWLSNNVDLL